MRGITARVALPWGSMPSYTTATWLFLRLLGVVYLFAFWSLAQQIPGLIGRDGILPAAEYMADVGAWADVSAIGLDRFRLLPTLCWLSSSDAFLQGLAVAGSGLAALLVLGAAPVATLPLLWVLYLSLTVVGGDFLSYQWDSLLLEAGFLAVLVAPIRWRHRIGDGWDPPRLARWLIWWLLFRLVFGSGIVKLMSGDPTWRDLTALAVHYETQPLPTPIAWYAALLPAWVHSGSTVLVLAIELVVPWFVFIGGRVRKHAAFVLIGLQLFIAFTGNYGFFNLLAIALCVMLLDDQTLTLRAVPRRSPGAGTSRARTNEWAAAVAAIVTVPVSAAILASQLGFGVPLGPIRVAIEPFRSVNPYGLFAVMTTVRPEIVVEGSLDGLTWRTYEFFDKPGPLTRRPPWVAPFQPRLDWQMWFAALGSYEEERWFQRFCRRLLDGSPSVARLLAHDPFRGKPPRFVRATLYQYRFTGWSAGRATGAWWARVRIRAYSPTIDLERVE